MALTQSQQVAVRLHAEGVSLRDIAAALGNVSRQAILRWTQLPAFQAAVQAYRDQQARLAQEAVEQAQREADERAEQQASAERTARARAAMSDPELRAERRVALALEGRRVLKGGAALPAMLEAAQHMSDQLRTVADKFLEVGDLRGWVELWTRLADRTGHGVPKDDGSREPPKPYTPEQIERMSQQLLDKLASHTPTIIDATPPQPAPALPPEPEDTDP